MFSERNANPLRLIRNIRRIIDVNKASTRSIKNKSDPKRTYLVPCLKNTILVIIGINLATKETGGFVGSPR